MGQAAFFVEFLKASGVFDALVAGTAVLSMLCGHKRYAYITALRADGVLPQLLGMSV